MMTRRDFLRATVRQGGEIALIVLIALGLQALWSTRWLTASAFSLLVVIIALAKTIFFFAENLTHILLATRSDMLYHRVLALMGVNMVQITLSFALDFWCLDAANPASFSSINPDWTRAEHLFEFFFYSVLNFSFFGFGDVTPQTVPAKLITLLEVVLAFFTVIILLSDFISLKDSLRAEEKKNPK